MSCSTTDATDQYYAVRHGLRTHQQPTGLNQPQTYPLQPQLRTDPQRTRVRVSDMNQEQRHTTPSTTIDRLQRGDRRTANRRTRGVAKNRRLDLKDRTACESLSTPPEEHPDTA